MSTIHSSATVGPDVELADDVSIGPWCVLEGRVRLGSGVRLVANVHVQGPVEVGEGTIVYPGVCLGFPGQDVKFKLGDPTAGVVVGKHCQLREHATVHAATREDVPTRVGDHVFMMVNSHLGHDARVGNHVVMVNNSALGGHAQVDDRATLAGGVLVHQFARIGKMAFVSGGALVSGDVPPYFTAAGQNLLVGVNRVGMRRSGMPREHITTIAGIFRDYFRRSTPPQEILGALDEGTEACPPLAEIAAFVRSTKRGIMPGIGRPPRGSASWARAARRGELEPLADSDGELL